jgi:hypothetical protein
MSPTNQRISTWGNCDGKGTFGCLVSIALLGLMVLFTVKTGPPFFSYKSLESDVKTEISRAGSHFFSNEVITRTFWMWPEKTRSA